MQPGQRRMRGGSRDRQGMARAASEAGRQFCGRGPAGSRPRSLRPQGSGATPGPTSRCRAPDCPVPSARKEDRREPPMPTADSGSPTFRFDVAALRSYQHNSQTEPAGAAQRDPRPTDLQSLPITAMVVSSNCNRYSKTPAAEYRQCRTRRRIRRTVNSAKRQAPASWPHVAHDLPSDWNRA